MDFSFGAEQSGWPERLGMGNYLLVTGACLEGSLGVLGVSAVKRFN
jgi:hypothetical protein